MKIRILEDRLNDIVEKQINLMFDANNINWTMMEDDYGNECDYAAEFYLGDYDDDEILFRWYGEDYWSDLGNSNKIMKLVQRSPILEFQDSNQKELLDNMFGDRWETIFKMWFDKNFHIKVKTIE